MKNIDFNSMIIGALTCTCLFLIMGQVKNNEKPVQIERVLKQQTNAIQQSEFSDSQVGRYQAISGNKYEYFYLLDTGTGAVYTHIENPENTYKKKLADIWRRNPNIHAFYKP